MAILIDEVQYFKASELSDLIMAMHKMQQLQLPLVLIGAGLLANPSRTQNASSANDATPANLIIQPGMVHFAGIFG